MELSKLFHSVAVLSPQTLPAIDITRIEYDSRRAGEGALFCCFVGAKTDGHNYAQKAYEQGCRAFLVSRLTELPADAVQIPVENTRLAMATVCENFYDNPARKLRLIGITGTKGKTTTALLISAILNGAGKKCGYIGSNGVQICGKPFSVAVTTPTTPESRELAVCFAAMAEAGCEYCVMEVSSQALKTHRIAGLTFRSVLYTNLSPDHIGEGEHPDFADYLACKKRLFTDYPAENAIANTDDPYATDVAGEKVLSCSVSNPAADFFADSIQPYRDERTLGISFVCHTQGTETAVHLRSPGAFSVMNALLAVAVCLRENIPVAESAKTLASVSPEGRFEIVEGLPDRTFIIDYAHNGVSLTSALSVLREYKPNRLICLFGTVGGRTQNRRRELAEAATLADFCILTTDNPDFEPPEQIIDEIACHMTVPYTKITDRETAIRTAVRLSQPGDILLFAGKGHEKYQLICGKKVPFCEKDIITDECGREVTI